MKRKLCDSGQLDEAEKFLRKAIQLDPEQGEAYLYLGITCHSQGELEQAVASFRKSIELDPESVRSHLVLGKTLFYSKQDHEAARSSFESAIALDSRLAEAHCGLADTFLIQGDFERAIPAFRRSLEIDPENIQAQINLGRVLCDVKQDYEGAIVCFRKALEIDPEDSDAHCSLGAALREQGDLDGAIACHKKAIELDANNANSHNSAAWMLATTVDKDGRFSHAQQAVEWARRANELQPNNGGVLNTLGVTFYRAEQWQDAIDALQKSIEHDLDVPGNWLFLAMSHWHLDQKDKAKEWYDKALAYQIRKQAAVQKDAELQAFLVEAKQPMAAETQELKQIPEARPADGDLKEATNPVEARPTPAEKPSQDSVNFKRAIRSYSLSPAPRRRHVCFRGERST